jgi:hypothetical protein
MTDEDRAARKTRADELRDTIRQIRNPQDKTRPTPGGAPAPGDHKESPLEFIDRRMREQEAERKKVEDERRKAGG